MGATTEIIEHPLLDSVPRVRIRGSFSGFKTLKFFFAEQEVSLLPTPLKSTPFGPILFRWGLISEGIVTQTPIRINIATVWELVLNAEEGKELHFRKFSFKLHTIFIDDTVGACYLQI